MPSKKLGAQIRALLKANPGRAVTVRTSADLVATITKYYPKNNDEAINQGFYKEGVFIGDCDCNGSDTWGACGHYFRDHEPAKCYDLVEVIRVQDATDEP